MDEFRIIESISQKNTISRRSTIGIGDDCAAIPKGKDDYYLVTKDLIVEGVHFDLKKDHLEDVGYKAMMVNVSDIAACAGNPLFAFIGVSIPKKNVSNRVKAIYRGLQKAAKQFKINILGGDMTQGKRLVLSVTLIGDVCKKYIALRSNARKGDLIYVTGKLGGSIKGKHLRFTPRIKEAQTLAKQFQVKTMIDLSDGLIADLDHILKASSLGACINGDSIPINTYSKNIYEALKDGEDFELLFTITPDQAKKLDRAKSKKFHCGVTRIGSILKNQEKYVILNNKKMGFNHFKGYRHFQ